MELKDPIAKKVLKRANSEVLNILIREYPEDEIDYRSELDIVMDEMLHLIWKYEDDSYLQYEDLTYAKQVLKETHNGTGNVVLLPDFNFKYTDDDIKTAKGIINEYRRLKRLVKEYGCS